MVQQGSPQAEQAEITWKAREPEIAEARKDGMREVVEWIERFALRYHEAGGVKGILLNGEEWREQLKKWGINE